MFDQLAPHDWLKLPMETRVKLKAQFNIPRSGGTLVIGREVQSDGHTVKDLSVMNLEAMQKFTGLKTHDFVELFKQTLIKVNKFYEETENTGTSEVSPGTSIETTGPETGESKEPVVPAPIVEEPDSERSPDGDTDSCNGTTPEVREPDVDDKSAGPRSPGRPRSQK